MYRLPGQSTRGLLSLVMWLPALAGVTAGLWWILRKSLAANARPGDKRNADRLLAAILGNDKAALVAIFGPPRASAGFSAIAPAVLVTSDYLLADTWYYPLDRGQRTALVVQFREDIASRAQLGRCSGQYINYLTMSGNRVHAHWCGLLVHGRWAAEWENPWLDCDWPFHGAAISTETTGNACDTVCLSASRIGASNKCQEP